MAATRTEARKGFTQLVRLSLLEADADTLDHAITELNARLGKILWAVIGVVISTSTGALMLALNLIVKK